MLCIIGLCKGNFDMIKIIGNKLGCFENEKIKGLFNIFAKYQNIIFENESYGLPELSKGLRTAYFNLNNYVSDPSFSVSSSVRLLTKEGTSIASSAMRKGATVIGQEVHKQVQETTEGAMQVAGSYVTDMLYKELFKMFDKDNSGYLSYGEFCDVCKYMGLHMDEEESLKMFSTADTNQNNYIDVWEFQNVIVLVKLQIARNTLKRLGLTTEDLVIFGILTLIYLILLLVFIFLGIFAFSRAEGFNAVVNAILPIVAGIAAGARRIDLKEKIDRVKDYIKNLVVEFKQKF